ncbi:hypothetical protein FRAHR75_1600001 [Frankia sp. Hr75.2]|nr:hypothetical protein FRAHR75_1600001 [Frankia sp. Hr75.2]
MGWLLATARRRAIDSFRRRSALDERYAMLAGQLAEGGASSGAVTPRDRADDLPWDQGSCAGAIAVSPSPRRRWSG